jgi:ABC-type multidrug transport system fused ATPase/permease subunit
LDFHHGRIEIDDIDIASIPRSILRNAMTVIPQDPMILPGTVRFCMDSRSNCSDADIEDALRKVKLWEHIVSLGGLDADLDIEFLSSGQRQLLCLAGGILSDNRIVLLDEATSK